MRGQRQQPRKERSPRREMITSQLDEHSHRIKELLRADLTMLEEQNALLKVKCKKVSQLEDKVELVLRQNNQLMSENQKLSRMLHQQKGQNENIRVKFQSQLAQKMNSFSDFQYQKKKLLSQIQNLNVELRQLEGIKNMQINQIKTQFQVEYQNLKRQHGSTIEMYQQQIRKFKQLLDKRQAEVNEYANRLKRVNSDTQYEIIKLNQEKQKLRSQIDYMELDHKKDMQDLKHRLDSNYLQQLQNMKKNHLLNLQAIQNENNKLKHLLSQKSRQVQELSTKLNKNKIFFDDSMMMLRRQNDNLKMQLIQLQKIGQNQKNDMEDKLRYLHQNQVDEITHINKSHIRELQNEIMNLQSTNQAKSCQIQQLLTEKIQARNLFNAESNRLKQQIDMYKMKLNDLQNTFNNKTKNLESKLREEQSHGDYMQRLNRQQKNNYESELSTMKELLHQQKNEQQRQRLNHMQVEQNYKQKQNQLQNQRDQTKDNLKRQKIQKQKSVENLKNQLASTQREMKSKLQSLLSKIAMIQRQNQALKKNIVLKDKEIKTLTQRLRAGQARQRKLELQIDEVRDKMLKKDQKNNDSITEQKQRLQKSFAYSLENINSDHAAAMRLQASKIKQLKDKLAKKDKQLQNLLKMYKKMTDQWKALTEQEANKKDINIKFPGASSDLIATKNLFDVFLKTKVLDVCGDAIQMKENIEQKK